MLELRLRTKAGWREVTTCCIGEKYNRPYETIVWGGRNRDRVAFQERHTTSGEAERRHQEIVEDAISNPTKYRIPSRNLQLMGYDRVSTMFSPIS
ncbi:MAG: hypothetical protein AABX29_09570 [Nanoarchaeota archaeon]